MQIHVGYIKSPLQNKYVCFFFPVVLVWLFCSAKQGTPQMPQIVPLIISVIWLDQKMSMLRRRKLLQGDNHCNDCFIVCSVMERGSLGRLFLFSLFLSNSKDALSQVSCKIGATKMHHYNHHKRVLSYLSHTACTVTSWFSGPFSMDRLTLRCAFQLIQGSRDTVEPQLSGLVGTSVKSPDNRESG